jgi:hypothetical protein
MELRKCEEQQLEITNTWLQLLRLSLQIRVKWMTCVMRLLDLEWICVRT